MQRRMKLLRKLPAWQCCPPRPPYSAILRQMEADEEPPFPGVLQHSRSLPARAVSPGSLRMGTGGGCRKGCRRLLAGGVMPVHCLVTVCPARVRLDGHRQP